MLSWRAPYAALSALRALHVDAADLFPATQDSQTKPYPSCAYCCCSISLQVDVADVFAAIQESKTKQGLKVQAWGIANTTLEDVFIRIATEAQAGIALS